MQIVRSWMQNMENRFLSVTESFYYVVVFPILPQVKQVLRYELDISPHSNSTNRQSSLVVSTKYWSSKTSGISLGESALSQKKDQRIAIIETLLTLRK